MRGDQLIGFRPVPMRPLPDRLRTVGETVPICKEAADEIEKLRRQVEHLVDIMNGISRQTAEVVRANKVTP